MIKFHGDNLVHPEEIALRVLDLKTMTNFYNEVMGFILLEESDERSIFSLDGENKFLTLRANDEFIPKSRGKTGLYHYAILLPTREDLGSFINHLVKKGYNRLGGSNHGVSEALYIQDPEDNGIEIYADVEDNKWEYNGDQVKMVTEPLDYTGLMEVGKDKEFVKIPQGTILGHIHLHVDDLDKSLKFYNRIGFELVSSLAGSAYFISTGGYHHHIGMNVWNGRGAKSPEENESGLDYYTLKVPEEVLDDILKNLDDSGYDYKRLEGNKILTKDPAGNNILMK